MALDCKLEGGSGQVMDAAGDDGPTIGDLNNMDRGPWIGNAGRRILIYERESGGPTIDEGTGFALVCGFTELDRDSAWDYEAPAIRVVLIKLDRE